GRPRSPRPVPGSHWGGRAPARVRTARDAGRGVRARRGRRAGDRCGAGHRRRVAFGTRGAGRAGQCAEPERRLGIHGAPRRVSGGRHLFLVEASMSLSAALENGMFALAQVLRLPVMALLWVCIGVALLLAGAAAMDAVARRNERRLFRLERWLNGGEVLAAGAERVAELPLALRRMLNDVQALAARNALSDGGLEHALLEHEERVRAGATAARVLVRVGPSLGLIGTLIPMGTALASLATGNREAMSGQMIVAFTTTIIGIASGTIAFVVLTLRQSWIGETVREMRFIAERAAAELAAQPE